MRQREPLDGNDAAGHVVAELRERDVRHAVPLLVCAFYPFSLPHRLGDADDGRCCLTCPQLFADAGISHPPADPTIPAFGHPLTLDSLQPTPSSPATSSASAVTLPLTAGSAGPSSTSPPEPAFAATSDDAHLSALERGIQALFDKLKHGPRAIGGREGLFKGSKEAQAEAVKDVSALPASLLRPTHLPERRRT